MKVSPMKLRIALCCSLLAQAIAFSVQGPPVERKHFLGKVASSLVCGGISVGSFVVNPDAAIAIQKIYQPPADSQNGKVHVITGATTGLGLESAKRIATAGATIVITSRTASKGEQAVQKVQDYLSLKHIENSEVYYLTLDLDDLDSVKSFPERYNRRMSNKPIDVLMNNAGVGNIVPREFTKDGFERTFQSNHLVSSNTKPSSGCRRCRSHTVVYVRMFRYVGSVCIDSSIVPIPEPRGRKDHQCFVHSS
jgi:hypothetical protein